MPEATGGQAIVQALKTNGVEIVFGLPGTHILPIYDALIGSGIRTIQVRHEQGAAGMADGYARMSGKPGVVLTITGPGALNASASLATAYADSSPVFLIASTIPSPAVDKARGAMHEVKHQLGVFKSLAKWAARA